MTEKMSLEQIFENVGNFHSCNASSVVTYDVMAAANVSFNALQKV